MKLAFIAIGAVALLVALAFALGSSMNVRHTATVERKFSIKVDDLWDLITDYNHFIDWRHGLKALTVDSLNHWTETNKHGDRVSYRMEVIEEKRTLITRILNKDLPYGGYWQFSLTVGEDHCTIKITENGEVYNPLFRLLSKFVFGHEATLTEYLKDLEARVNDFPVKGKLKINSQ